MSSVAALTLPDGFALARRLGAGGFGEVWQATAPGGVPVALKFLEIDSRGLAVELRALEAIKSLRHAHLLTLLGVWQLPTCVMIAMELAECTLLDRARQHPNGVLPPAELLEYMRQAAEALDFLNGKGIQHRDVKPQNLLLVPGGLKVGDFGLAKLLEHSVSAASGRMTPAYAAPEFFHEQATTWSDQYSLAVTYCQLRGGQFPFPGNAAQILAGHLNRAPDLSMLPANERPAVARALAKDPRQRWPSCADFVGRLRTALVPAPVFEVPDAGMEASNSGPEVTWRTHPPTTHLARRRRPLARAALAGLAVLILVGGLVALLKGYGDVDPDDNPTAQRSQVEQDPQKSQAEKEAEAAARLRKRGATVTVAKDRPGRPVVGVQLGEDARPETLALLGELRQLEELDLSPANIDDAGGLAHLPALPWVRKLYLLSCYKVTDDGFKHLAALSGLEELAIGYGMWGGSIGDKGLGHLRVLTRLRTLKLGCCRRITAEGIKHLAAMPALAELLLQSTNVGGKDLVPLKSLTKLRSLDLEGCENVNDDTLRDVSALAALDELDVSWTNITNAGLAYLKDLPRLRKLTCGWCERFTDEGLKHVAAIPTLQSLVLISGRFSNEGLQPLRALTGLRELDLSGCQQLTDDGLKQVAAHGALEELSIRTTNIGAAGLAHLKTLPRLRMLDVANCPNINDEGLRHMAAQTSLEVLRLTGTTINGSGLAHINSLARLRRLDLSYCKQLTDEGCKHLAACPALEELFLQETAIGDTSLAHIRTLTTLRKLDLFRCKNVRDEGLTHLAFLTKLEELNCWGTNISDAGLASLTTLKSLQFLTVRECPLVSDRGVGKLKREMPELQIDR